MFLIKNGIAVANIASSSETTLKEVRASYQSADDLNAQYPKVLVNAQTYKVSKNKKYAKLELPTALHKTGFRENEFLIIE